MKLTVTDRKLFQKVRDRLAMALAKYTSALTFSVRSASSFDATRTAMKGDIAMRVMGLVRLPPASVTHTLLQHNGTCMYLMICPKLS